MTYDIFLWSLNVADVYIDIDDTFDKKIDALYCHVSQMSTTKQQGYERLRKRFSEYGYKVNAQLAEPFKHLKLRD